MLFIQLEWTNQRKFSYESLKQWSQLLQSRTRVWKTAVLHLPLNFYKRWRFNNATAYKER